MSSGNSGIRIRPASRKDVPAIVVVCTTSVSDEEVAGFGVPNSESLYADVGKLSAAWREPNYVGPEEVFVAEAGGRVVGCSTTEDRGDVLELVNIDVRPDFQGRGIGTRLVRYIEERAREQGKQAVTLGTSRSVHGEPWKSFPWWQAQGYVVTHEEENAWTRSIGSGVREIRMRKQLV